MSGAAGRRAVEDLRTAIGILSVFSSTPHITQSRKDMKAPGSVHRQANLHILQLRTNSIDGSPGHHVDSSVSVPMTLHAHNFKLVITQIINTHPSAVTPWNNMDCTGLI